MIGANWKEMGATGRSYGPDPTPERGVGAERPLRALTWLAWPSGAVYAYDGGRT